MNPVNTHAFLELIADELFEHWPHHVEQERLTYDVHFPHAEWHGFLLMNTGRKRKLKTHTFKPPNRQMFQVFNASLLFRFLLFRRISSVLTGATDFTDLLVYDGMS